MEKAGGEPGFGERHGADVWWSGLALRLDGFYLQQIHTLLQNANFGLRYNGLDQRQSYSD
jgi:hypothetical protein